MSEQNKDFYFEPVEGFVSKGVSGEVEGEILLTYDLHATEAFLQVKKKDLHVDGSANLAGSYDNILGTFHIGGGLNVNVSYDDIDETTKKKIASASEQGKYLTKYKLKVDSSDASYVVKAGFLKIDGKVYPLALYDVPNPESSAIFPTNQEA